MYPIGVDYFENLNEGFLGILIFDITSWILERVSLYNYLIVLDTKFVIQIPGVTS